jgi:enoyl-CoA hydratase
MSSGASTDQPVASESAESGLAERRDGHVVELTIDRPRQRNALSNDLLGLLATTMMRLDRDPDVRCIVLRGSDKVFASGADLNDLRGAEPLEHYAGDRVRAWADVRRTRTPTVAAVSGYCLGGGLELAMYCDVIIASETARFGFPETMLGLIPGAGGTQLLPALVGRAKAMDVILTGRFLTAAEAERAGLVSRIVAQESWRQEGRKAAHAIASRGPVAQLLARETVNAASDIPLAAGLELERRAFAMALGSAEAREGIDAFLARRPPSWRSNFESAQDNPKE